MAGNVSVYGFTTRGDIARHQRSAGPAGSAHPESAHRVGLGKGFIWNVKESNELTLRVLCVVLQ